MEEPSPEACAAAVQHFVLAQRLQRPRLQAAARGFIVAHAGAVAGDGANLAMLCRHPELVGELMVAQQQQQQQKGDGRAAKRQRGDDDAA